MCVCVHVPEIKYALKTIYSPEQEMHELPGESPVKGHKPSLL